MDAKELFRPTQRKIYGMILLTLLAFLTLAIIQSLPYSTECTSFGCRTAYALIFLSGLVIGFPGTILFLFKFSTMSWAFIIQLLFDYFLSCFIIYSFVEKREKALNLVYAKRDVVEVPLPETAPEEPPELPAAASVQSSVESAPASKKTLHKPKKSVKKVSKAKAKKPAKKSKKK